MTSFWSRGKTIIESTSRPARRALWNVRMRAYDYLGVCERMRGAQRGGLRILTYHGVCRDAETQLPWVPPYFVTESLLDRHLTWIREVGEIAPLCAALDLLDGGRATRDLAYVITFDDGYYNNLSLAAPILQTHGASATCFLTTGPIDAGGVVPPWMKGRMLRGLSTMGRIDLPGGEAHRILAASCDWGSVAAAESIPSLEALWKENAGALTLEWLDGMRFMDWAEVKRLSETGFELGAHTVNHPHLSLLSDAQRRSEVVESLNRVRAFTGTSEACFAYPYGRSRDFGDYDVQVLRELRVPLAVSTTIGCNRRAPQLDIHRLCRLPVSRQDTREKFLGMISGLYDEDRRWQPPD